MDRTYADAVRLLLSVALVFESDREPYGALTKFICYTGN